MQLIITAPDDWHLHLRDGDALQYTVPDAARQFKRAIVMPNLSEPVTTVAQARAYQQRILQHVPAEVAFAPLMTLYLTDTTDPEEVTRAKASGLIAGIKLYPAGATTHSNAGVTRLENVYPVLERMQKVGMPLLVHGEVTAAAVDIFDRERIFIEQKLQALHQMFPALKIVLEHITTQDAVEFVEAANACVAATITPQHLWFNRNDMLVGGIRPHLYCLPILKKQVHQLRLIQAATSGNPKFFAGTDSAPHARLTKESACGCAGCYSAPYAVPMYAQIFEAHKALDKLEAFISVFGAQFYGLPVNQERITLCRQPQDIPLQLAYVNHDTLIPLGAGQTLDWQVMPV